MFYNTELIITGVRVYRILQISQILSQAAIIQGLDVKTAEFTHESLTAPEVVHIRIGKKIYSPLIPEKTANILVCFEPSILNQCVTKYLAPGVVVVVNSNTVLPLVEPFHKNIFPFNVLTSKIIQVDMFKIDDRAEGSNRINFVMLGILSNLISLSLSFSNIIRAIEEIMESKYIESCFKAIEIGRQI
jgi:indolepyruvate ferredoxin oxidoreductase, beta subunit